MSTNVLQRHLGSQIEIKKLIRSQLAYWFEAVRNGENVARKQIAFTFIFQHL